MLQLRFRDYSIFQKIKDGSKTVETRALNPDEPDRYFGDVKTGDNLELLSVDTGEVLVRKVVGVRIYPKMDDYLKKEDLTKVQGGPTTKEQMGAKHYTFPGYKERLEKYGIVAFEIE